MGLNLIKTADGKRQEEKGRVTWWFCQGRYWETSSNPTYFVLSFFHGYTLENNKSHHYLFLALKDPDAQTQHKRCVVDQGLIDTFSRQLNSKKLNFDILDRFMAEAILREITEYGLPSHFELQGPPEILNSTGWLIRWNDFSLKWKGERIELAFEEPGTGKPFCFILESTSPPMDLKALGVPRLQNTSYVTFPRMKLKGFAGEKEVKGDAWFDHQVSDPSEIMLDTHDEQSRLIGWEWFAVNLEDGSDFLVQQFRDMRTREILNKYAVFRPRGGTPKVLTEFEAQATQYWVSSTTHIQYPIAWRLSFPELQTQWEFRPFFHDQEVPMVGYMRALWEGSGTVKGTALNSAISGKAHLELNGYGYIFDFKQYTKVFVDRIDELIEDFFPRSLDGRSIERFVGKPLWRHDPEVLTETMSRPVWDLLDRGGKHWRPMLGFLLLETLGVSSEPYESLLANVIELNHTGALIIDDIEDDSLIRRGEECIHLRYGTDVAINSGTVLYFLPYLILTKDLGLTNSQLVGLYRIVVSFQIKAHLGQGMDIAWTKKMSPQWLQWKTENGFSDQILQMYSMKTGAATQGTAEAACVIASADKAVQKAYSSFGRAFGVSFQIIDDVLNFTGSPNWTKMRGEDLAAGKPTWIIVRALELLSPEDREELVKIICNPELRSSPEGRERGVELVLESGALERGRRKARDMLENEWRNFSTYASPSEAKTMLRMLVTGLLSFDQDY